MPGPTVWELVQLLQKWQLATQLEMLHWSKFFCSKKTGIFLPVLLIYFSAGILPPEDQPAKELQPLGKAARKAMNRRLGIWDVFLYSTTRFKHSGTSFALKFQRLRREKEEAEYALQGCG